MAEEEPQEPGWSHDGPPDWAKVGWFPLTALPRPRPKPKPREGRKIEPPPPGHR